MASLPQTALRRVLNAVERVVPARYGLAYEMLRLRARGGLEPELAMLGSILDRRDLAIDAGANRGYYTYALSRLVARVEAFEPSAGLLDRLRASGATNVRIHHVGLSSEAGTRTLYVPEVDGTRYDGWASFDRGNLPTATRVEEVEIPICTLDSYAFQDVSFIKIDVEGHEAEVLRGARATLERSRPVVLSEVRARNRAEVFGLFDSLGYRTSWLRDGGLVDARPGGAIDPRLENFVFRPR